MNLEFGHDIDVAEQSWLRVEGLGFRVQGLGFRVEVLELSVKGLGFRD